MTPEQIRAYATDLIREAATSIEFLTIVEAAEDSRHVPGDQISEDDAAAVADAILRASVTVTWPDGAGGAPAAQVTGPTADLEIKGRDGAGRAPVDPDICPAPIRVDGPAHSWRFDGDDPYVICRGCDEMRDAMNGRVIRAGRTS